MFTFTRSRRLPGLPAAFHQPFVPCLILLLLAAIVALLTVWFIAAHASRGYRTPQAGSFSTPTPAALWFPSGASAGKTGIHVVREQARMQEKSPLLSFRHSPAHRRAKRTWLIQTRQHRRLYHASLPFLACHPTPAHPASRRMAFSGQHHPLRRRRTAGGGHGDLAASLRFR